MTNLIKQLAELKQLPSMEDAAERERETYEEENVKRLLINGRSQQWIARRCDVSLGFVRACKQELHREGFNV